MNRSEFDKIVDGQTRITDPKEIVKNYKKVGKRCGFLNSTGYDDRESNLTPVTEYGEVRLIEIYQGEEQYSDYVKIKNPIDDWVIGGGHRGGRNEKWYGVNGDYLIVNIGPSGCHTVYRLNASLVRKKRLKELGI